jgi:hypothetical protein
MEPETNDPIAELIIDGLGGTVVVALLCRVDPSAVSQWRKNGIPNYRIDFLRLARGDWNWSQIPEGYGTRRAA